MYWQNFLLFQDWNSPWYVYTTFLYSFISGHLDYFQMLAVVNIAAVNMEMQLSLQDPDFSSLGLIPRRTMLEHMVVLSETFFEETPYSFS